MRVVLTHGYFLAEDPAEARVMKPYPPLGLLYLSAYLKSRDVDVHVLDATFISRDEYRRSLNKLRPQIVGVYATLMTRQNALWIVQEARALGARVVLGGPEPVNYAEEYLEAGADVVVAGEGEQTLAELVQQHDAAGTKRLSEITGIIYRDEAGEVTRTPPRTLYSRLDELPFPDREAIDFEAYLSAWQRHHGVRSASVITARGCPYTCRWCSHSVYGFSHRRRSPENVADELELLRERYAPDQVWYADDVFTINRRWLFRYADELDRRGLHFPFETITREDRLNEQVVETLSRMGCYRIWIGAESGSQRVLDAMDRRTNAERMREMTALLQRYGIRAGTFIMVGYEGETWRDINETAEHLTSAVPDDVLTTLAYPIKGTAYHDEVRDRIVEIGPWSESSDRDLTVAGRRSRRFYGFAQRWLRGRVEAARLRRSGETSFLALTRHRFWNAINRTGMYLTRFETERRP